MREWLKEHAWKLNPFAAMEYGAIDLHKKESQVRILTESGEVIDQRIRTTRDRLTALFWGRPPARILIEASTESE